MLGGVELVAKDRWNARMFSGPRMRSPDWGISMA
jgi:hypothetical protein